MIILLQCTDRIGLVADIARIMAAASLNIISMREYVDTAAARFFIRIETQDNADIEILQSQLLASLPEDTQITINPPQDKKVIVMVTKEHHCLGDILLRDHFNTLGAKVQCVIGNHETLRGITQRFGIPFHYVSHKAISKEIFEEKISAIIRQYETDYIVLAKFMRILSPAFIAQYPMRIINIHHSFLPAFVGASPYRQAYERGVKLIGATAHFVTNDLDEGPIIAQQIIPVNHAHTVNDMVTLGQEIEKSVLAKGLQLVCNNRVMLQGNKTVVFEN